MGVQRVGGDHDTRQVQVGQQRNQARDFAGGAADGALGEHGTGGVVHRGQQMDLPAVVACGAPQRLAVDRDRPPSMLLAGTVPVIPRAGHRRQRRWVHAGKGPTDGGLGGHHPAVAGSGYDVMVLDDDGRILLDHQHIAPS